MVAYDKMRVLFLNHGDSCNNSFHHIAGFANGLTLLGHECAVVCHGSGSKSIPPACDGVPVYAYGRMNQVLDSFIPDILHAWTPREGIRKRLFDALGRANRAPAVIIHLEDNEEEIVLRSKIRDNKRPLDAFVHPAIWRNVLALSDGVTVISEPLAAFVPQGVAHFTLPPLADEKMFRPFAQDEIADGLCRALPHDAFLIGYTGNDNPANRDDIREMVCAVKRLRDMGCPARLVRTGALDSSHYEGFGFDPTEFILNLGFVPYDEIPGILASCDVLVQPGCPNDDYNAYRLPSKLPEYLLSGKPVVSASYPGLPFTDSIDALVLENGIATEMCEKLATLWRSPDLCATLGRAGRKFALRMFCDQHRILQLATFYSDCLQRSVLRCGLRFLLRGSFTPPQPTSSEWNAILPLLRHTLSECEETVRRENQYKKEAIKSSGKAASLQVELDEIRSSLTWRIQKPLHAAEFAIRALIRTVRKAATHSRSAT